MNRRKDILYGALASSLLLVFLHILALNFYFYWIYWWYDVVMHFLGGFTGALASYWVLFHSGIFWQNIPNWKTIAGVTFFCLMTAGVLWEVMEYKNGMIDSFEGYYLDVFNDLVLDGLGALLAIYVGLRKNNAS